MKDSMVGGVREFLCACPLLEAGKLNVDYLGSEPTEYSMERVAENELLKQYSDGGKLKQFVFLFSSREWVGNRVEEHVKTAEFYEKFAKWLEEKSLAGELPLLESGKTAQSLEAVSGGILYDHTGECGKYQIRCRLIYLEEG